jgi:Flp pilus assembly pilin Flp
MRSFAAQREFARIRPRRFLWAYSRCIFCDEVGATAIEDALTAAGIVLAIVAAVITLGSVVQQKFVSLQNALP